MKKYCCFLLFTAAALISLGGCNLPISTTVQVTPTNPLLQSTNTPALPGDTPLPPTPSPTLPLDTPLPPTTTPTLQETLPAVRIPIQLTDLEYLGAFRLPEPSGSSSWEYSGRGLTFYPEGDPQGDEDGFPGSLFGVGHDELQNVSEISIPIPVISRNLEDLNTADTLQPFSDITTGMFAASDLPRLGIQYLPAQAGQSSGKLHFVHGQHFQDFEPAYGWSELTLNDPQSAGPWRLDGYTNYITSDYLFEIPADWSAQIPGTPRLASGRFREGVWGGRGPTLLAFSPPQGSTPPETGEAIQNITPLLLYGKQISGETDIHSDASMQMSNYSEDDSWWGGAWLTSGSRSAVVFTGTKASGKTWYGFANGVVWDYACAEQSPPICPDVPEWPYDNRGYWAETYQPQILFFHPEDLIAVANGQMQTWEPQPYAVLDLSDTFFDPSIHLETYKYDLAGAVAYDRERGLLYIIERLADGPKSVIHVWRIR